MATKIIEHSATAATQISTFSTDAGVKMVNIRSMYKKKSDKADAPWSFGARAISLPVDGDQAEEVLKKALKVVRSENTKYPKLKRQD